MCDVDTEARRVLKKRFENDVYGDIRSLRSLPRADLVAAGFPCQDLSLAGTQLGLSGPQSSLVGEVFRLISKSPPEFVLLENVLYLVKRQRGRLIRHITHAMETLGYRWAYRVVDVRGFGLPQRRQRVIILGSRMDVDPRAVLFGSQVPADTDDRIVGLERAAYGFYWTEGKRAVGWAPDAVPTIKGGSSLGIPSPPAVFDVAARTAGTPSISDGERLQGFPRGWTNLEDEEPVRLGARWRLIGNAVPPPVAAWIGRSLRDYQGALEIDGHTIVPGKPMPYAAGICGGVPQRYDVSLHVEAARSIPIMAFLEDPLTPLSQRALAGFLRRARSGVVKYPGGFLEALDVQAAGKTLTGDELVA